MRPSLITTFVIAFAFLFLPMPSRAQDALKIHPPENPKKVAPKQAESDPGDAVISQRTWVGVATMPLEQSLREHLELDEGFGIQVIEVLPDSPASAAGLRSNDIILRFGDQRIISPEHLSLLVRAEKSGKKVVIALIRKGKEEKVELTLGETDEARFPARPGFGAGSPYSSRSADLRRHQDSWRDWMNQNHPEWRGNTPARERNRESHSEQRDDTTDPDRPPEGRPRSRPRTGPHESHPRGVRPPAVSVRPGFPLRVFGSEGVLKIDNEQGELTLTREDNKHTLELKNAAGEVVYSGPFDPKTGVEALPQEARDHLETMKLGNFEIRLPEIPRKEPDNINAPSVEKPDEAPEPAKGGIL